jgi:hypothetical protein
MISEMITIKCFHVGIILWHNFWMFQFFGWGGGEAVAK